MIQVDLQEKETSKQVVETFKAKLVAKWLYPKGGSCLLCYNVEIYLYPLI